jgi:hypothetical protein
MGRHPLLLVLAVLLLAGCTGRAASTPEAPSPGPVSTDVSTSPAGVSDQAPSGLLLAIVQWGRQFRGNPIPLGVVTGVLLFVALGLGVYTLRLPGPENPARASVSPRGHSPRAE